MRTKKRCVHIYTGDGKGKTTAALGLVVRALSAGENVLFAQFLKGKEPESAVKFLCKFFSEDKFHAFVSGYTHPAFWCSKDKSQDRIKKLKKGLKDYFTKLVSIVRNKEYTVVVLDEILGCLKDSFLDDELIFDFLKTKPKDVEVILTGRGASYYLIDKVDYVSFVLDIRHPFRTNKIPARRGIDY